MPVTSRIIYRYLADPVAPMYLIGDRYVTFFIDQHEGDVIRSIYWVDKELEENTFYRHKAESPSYRESSEALNYILINQERADRGLSILKRNDDLADVARAHSADMAENDFFSHTNLQGESPGDRAEKAGFINHGIGENLSYNYEDIIHSHEGLMDSYGHRRNILNPDYKQVGIGVDFDSNSGPYVTQKFYVY